MKIRNVLVGSTLAAALFACGGASSSPTKANFDKFNALPAPDKAAFNNCTKIDNMQVRDAKACSQYGIMEQRYQDCHAAVKGTYASLANLDARKSWLAEQGCTL